MSALERRLYSARTSLALALGLVVLGLGIAVAFTVLGWAWPIGWFRPISLSDEVETLLAAGTVFLGFAAYLQALTSDLARRDALAPWLDLELLAPSLRNETSNPVGPESTWVEVTGADSLQFRVRNLGPGNAAGVSVRALLWKDPKPYADWERPSVLVNLGFFTTGAVPVTEKTLVKDEGQSFALGISAKIPPANSGAPTFVLLTRRLLLEATGVNTAGEPARPCYTGVNLVLAEPARATSRLELPGVDRSVPNC